MPSKPAPAHTPIRYAIQATHPGAHVYQVTVEIDDPHPKGQTFRLPAWIPGSYMIRDFSRHLGRVRALDDRGGLVAVSKTDKQTWVCAPVKPGRSLCLAYEVYAFDLSVRAAHLDTTHGFFNASSVFVWPVGQEDRPCDITIIPPEGPGYANWRIATALKASKGTRQGQFGQYQCQNYAALIDSPVEMGGFVRARFEVAGVTHEIAITGKTTQLDMDTLCQDLTDICATHARLFEPKTKRPPFDRYTFLVFAVDEGYGGLEHQTSTALLCRRDDLPHLGATEKTAAYRRFLGLASHEYFHAWNVTRIKPAELVIPDLTRETHTRLLWLFEGFTSYYDDLGLRRAGLLSSQQYLVTVADTLAAVLQHSGRLRQSLAESSFDAWTKYYKQDENAPNSIVSYYQKGALVALALDLYIRNVSKGKRSLDDVMRYLWRDYLQAEHSYGGILEEDLGDMIRAATGVDVQTQLEDWVYAEKDPDFVALLAPFGVDVQATDDERNRCFAFLGCKLNATGRVAQVYDGSPAQVAGLSAGDDILALDGIRAQGDRLEKMLARYQPGQTAQLLVFRRDELLALTLTLAKRPPQRWNLKLNETRSDDRAASLRRDWLGAEPKAQKPAA